MILTMETANFHFRLLNHMTYHSVSLSLTLLHIYSSKKNYVALIAK